MAGAEACPGDRVRAFALAAVGDAKALIAIDCHHFAADMRKRISCMINDVSFPVFASARTGLDEIGIQQTMLLAGYEKTLARSS